MPRGDPPRKLETLVDYFLGGRYAVAAFYARARERDPELAAAMLDYIRNVDGYIDAVRETYKLKQPRVPSV
jgi:hypothetical protein